MMARLGERWQRRAWYFSHLKRERGASMNEERRRELEASTSLGETSLWIDYADVYGHY
jgi:hypothetical protein